jgi:hypothetical protein
MLLRRLRISQTKTLAGLSNRQRHALADELRSRA